MNLDPDEEVNMEKVREINVEIGDATAACKGKMSHKADGYDTLKKFIVPESKRLIAPPAVKKVYYGAWANDSTHVCLAGQVSIYCVTRGCCPCSDNEIIMNKLTCSALTLSQ